MRTMPLQVSGAVMLILSSSDSFDVELYLIMLTTIMILMMILMLMMVVLWNMLLK